jgi:hypothetical protein
MDPARPRARAVVMRDDHLVYVGDEEGALRMAGPDAQRQDLQGRLVLPGFIDNHVHFVLGGTQVDGLDLRSCRTPGEFRERTAAFVAGHHGSWVTGGDWDQEAWEDKALPRRQWLDPFSPGTPILLQRFDAHMAVANSAALERAGIHRETPDPPGGRIERDLDGTPTGILKDAAMTLVAACMPRPSPLELERVIRNGLAAALAHGVTSVQDISEEAHVELYRKLDREGALTCRIYARLPLEGYRRILGGPMDPPEGRVRTGSMKAFADGSLGSGTAWFLDPYGSEATSGLPMETMADGRLRTRALAADRCGLQLSIHAIGDRATHEVLDLFEEIARVNPPWDRRPRLEHAQHMLPEDIRRMAALGVIASVQPYHCIDDGCWAEARIGPERALTTYPFRSFLDAGVPLCFGSDWTVAPLDPLLGIHAAVTRATLDGRNPGGWIPGQRITVEEAVRCYTLAGAYASFEENLKGSLTPGKWADMVVLDHDLFELEPERIPEAKVVMTVLGGEIVYER